MRQKEEQKNLPKNRNRRDFFRKAATATAGTVALNAGLASAEQKLSAAKQRFAMVIDLRKCYGCNACTIACKAEFDVPIGNWRSWVNEVEKGEFPDMKRHFTPQLCNHCDESPCTVTCPTGASYQREDGLVLVDDDQCIGCSACIAACPYGSRFMNPDTKVVEKCDFCLHRIENGVAPSCVNTCPANARIFGDLSDSTSEVFQLVKKNPTQVLRPEMKTEPHVFYIGLDSAVARSIKKPTRRKP